MRTTVRSSHRSIRNYDITLIHFGPTTTTTKHTHSIECLYNLPKFAKNASFRWKKVPQATDLYRAFYKTLYAMLQFMFAVGKSSQEKKCINSVVRYNTILSNAMNQTVLLAICIFFLQPKIQSLNITNSKLILITTHLVTRFAFLRLHPLRETPALSITIFCFAFALTSFASRCCRWFNSTNDLDFKRAHFS